jgi:hypothetical protein
LPAFLVRRRAFGECAATFCGVAVELGANGLAIGAVRVGGRLSKARRSFWEKAGAVVFPDQGKFREPPAFDPISDN